MAPESFDQTSPSPHGEHQQQALWPWLLLPLAVLALFFLLYQIRHAPLPEPPAAASADPADSPDAP